MRFDPNITINDRNGNPIHGFDKDQLLTIGSIAIKSLDNVAGKGDEDRLLRQFRISTQIYDAMSSYTTLNIPKDEMKLIMEVVKDMAVNRLSPDGVLIYGRFCEAVDDMKENEAHSSPNGKSEHDVKSKAV
jgi:hypothetical protein